MMADGPEVFAAEAEEGGTVELGVTANKVVGVGVERFAVLVEPRFLRVVSGLDVDGTGGPILGLAGDEVAAFKDEDAFAGGGKLVGKRGATCTRANDNHVVLVAGHVGLHCLIRIEVRPVFLGCCTVVPVTYLAREESM